MNRKTIIFSVFILVAIVQLYVPAKMILDKEDVLNSGIEYKFKAAPIDPNDPFRGKYITLRYEENSITIENEDAWQRGELIYVILMEDSNGFAKIRSVSKTEPEDGSDFIKSKIAYITSNGSNLLTIDYPIERYYMEESKAYEAELTYNESLRDTSQITYAIVNIKNGEAVLKDVMINGVSIKEIVKLRLEDE